MAGIISQENAHEKYESGQATFLDVRTPEEYAAGHIPGCLHINVQSDDFADRVNELPKDAEYVVYCRSGGRSAQAIQKMSELGFQNLENLEGGMGEWQQNYEVEK